MSTKFKRIGHDRGEKDQVRTIAACRTVDSFSIAGNHGSEAAPSEQAPLLQGVLLTILTAKTKKRQAYSARTITDSNEGAPPEARDRSSRLACVKG